MHESFIKVGIAAAVVSFAILAPNRLAGAAGPSGGQNFSQVELGRYVTTAADCAGCHTAPGDNRPFAGGRPIETPFGTVVAPNITPDRETGIGAWSDAEFDTALRQGKGRDGKRLYPAMPFPYYSKMSLEDVFAIRAYLNTVTPVHNAVVSNQLSFPLSIRAAMLFWDALYFSEGQFKPGPGKPAAWNRGAYLVEGPGHCGACHTPKTLLGGDKSRKAFRGYSIQGWFAPDITNDDRRGLGRWSVADIVAYLKNGHNRFSAASGPMAEEISRSSSKMSEQDLEAIATYLKDLPGRKNKAEPVAADDPVMVAGGAIYRDLCSACHKADGSGVPSLFPSLSASSSVMSQEPTTLLRVVLQGAQSIATDNEPTAPAMPAFGWQLTDEQIAALITYIRNSFGNEASAIMAGEVHKARVNLAERNE